jgi:hypothetical protein
VNGRRSTAALACALSTALVWVAVASAQEPGATPQPPPAPEPDQQLDVAAPRLVLGGRRVQRLGPHFEATALCDEPCEFDASARVVGVPGLTFLRVLTPTKAGEDGRQMRFAIRVSRRAHKLINNALRDGQRVRVAVDVAAYDLADNEATGTRWIRVVPPGAERPLTRS